MGESKRRKMLDPNYGVAKKPEDFAQSLVKSNMDSGLIITKVYGASMLFLDGENNNKYWMVSTNTKNKVACIAFSSEEFEKYTPLLKRAHGVDIQAKLDKEDKTIEDFIPFRPTKELVFLTQEEYECVEISITRSRLVQSR